jgi:hypothetical protein
MSAPPISFPRISSLPVQLVLSLSGKKVSSLLSDMTGISSSRLRPGSSQTLRPSTLNKATAHMEGVLRKKLEDKDWPPASIESFIASAPSKLNGYPCAFGDLLHSLSGPGISEYPLTSLIAQQLDQLDIKLERALATGDLDAYKAAVASQSWLSSYRWWSDEKTDHRTARQMFQLADDWDALAVAVKPIVLNILLAFMAAIDLEFSASYFHQFRLRPLFLDLLPMLGPNASLNSLGKFPKWDRFRLPSRRLLELSHALHYRHWNKAWPMQCAGRSQISAAVYLTDFTIGNLFDGSKKLSFQQFDSIWKQLCLTTSKTPVSATPTPLLLAAWLWQSKFVEFDDGLKVRSIFLFDGHAYLTWWNHHRENWGSQLTGGTADWPQWLGDVIPERY